MVGYGFICILKICIQNHEYNYVYNHKNWEKKPQGRFTNKNPGLVK